MRIFKTKEKGQSLIEFAVFIPILMICLLAGIEFAFLYIQAQKISNICREIAYASYRDCLSSDLPTLTACMDDVLNQVGTKITGGMLPNFNQNGTMILTVYDNSMGASSPIRRTFWSGGATSKLIASPPDAAVIGIEGRLTVGEVFYQYTPVTPVNNLLKLARFPSLIYETVSY